MIKMRRVHKKKLVSNCVPMSKTIFFGKLCSGTEKTVVKIALFFLSKSNQIAEGRLLPETKHSLGKTL